MNAHDRQEHTQHVLSRRDFFKRGGAGLIAASLAALLPSGLIAFGESGSAPRNIWTQATFGAQVGQEFSADLGHAGKQTLKLAQVTAGSAKIQKGPHTVAAAKSGESFVLTFLGKTGAAAKQGTFQFLHPKTGSFSLFIVPGSLDQGGQHYVAVVNRALS